MGFGTGERLVDAAEFGELRHRVIVLGHGLHLYPEAAEAFACDGSYQFRHRSEVRIDRHGRCAGLLGQAAGAQRGRAFLGQDSGGLAQEMAAHFGGISLEG